MESIKREKIEQELQELFENKDLFIDTSMIVNSEYEYIEGDYFFEMDEIDYILESKTPTEIINFVKYGDINLFDDYFKFDGYGHIESFNSLYDFYIDYDYDLIDTIVKNIDTLENELDEEIVNIVLQK